MIVGATRPKNTVDGAAAWTCPLADENLAMVRSVDSITLKPEANSNTVDVDSRRAFLRAHRSGCFIALLGKPAVAPEFEKRIALAGV
jgi:hypothetical protein